MLLRFCRLRSLLAALVLVSACQRTISTGDALPSVTFDGRVYAVVSGELFNLDRENLTNIGVPSQSSLSDQDRFVYALDGILPAQAAVAYDGGHAVLLVERGLIQALPTEFPAGSDPLASGIPSLCKYWRDPPSNCT
jgi:hypothetical protein